jgi:putative nucleotidyltransferase with HDIG domain
MRRRPALGRYVLTVSAVAWALVIVFAPSAVPSDLPLAVGLLVMATAAKLRPIHLTQKMKMNVADTATFAAALVLVPWLALVVGMLSSLVASFARSRKAHFEAGFNAACSGIGCFAAAWVFFLMGGDSGAVAMYAPAVVAAAATKYLVHTSLVDVTAALQLRRDPIATWWPVHRRDLPQTAALYALGALMAIVADANPLAIALFGLPVVAVYVSMRQAARLRVQTRAAIVEFARLIDLRDKYTHGHSQRVAAHAERIAVALRFAPTQVELVRDAALLHDLGKIRTGDHVLQKPGPLDPHERDEMRMHVQAGAELLQRLPDFWEGAALVAAHHERYDGHGYPRGLCGADMPFEAAVIAVADAWDAMTSDRPYRRAMPVSQARAELIRWRGLQWDPRVVDAFLSVLDAPEPVRQPDAGRPIAAPAR